MTQWRVLLSVSEKSVRDSRWRRRVGLRAVHVGTSLRFLASDCYSLLERGRERLPAREGALAPEEGDGEGRRAMAEAAYRSTKTCSTTQELARTEDSVRQQWTRPQSADADREAPSRLHSYRRAAISLAGRSGGQ
jgi:hypothetical protein